MKDKNQNEKDLTIKQSNAIASILEETSMDKAAKKAGVSRKTLYRWLEIPAFRRELERGQKVVFAGALARLQGAARLAVERLIEALDAKLSTERRLAASQILELCFKGMEVGEFSERITELEEKMGVSDTGRLTSPISKLGLIKKG